MGIPYDILGLTVLAWGNSIGDFVSNIVVAKQGMFVSECVSVCVSVLAWGKSNGDFISNIVVARERERERRMSDIIFLLGFPSMALAATYGGIHIHTHSFAHTHTYTLTHNRKANNIVFHILHSMSYAIILGPFFNMYLGLGIAITVWTAMV